MPRRDFIAMKAMMKYEPVAHYDSGEDGIFSECRSAAFIVPTQQIKPAYSEPVPTLFNPHQLTRPLIGYLRM